MFERSKAFADSVRPFVKKILSDPGGSAKAVGDAFHNKLVTRIDVNLSV